MQVIVVIATTIAISAFVWARVLDIRQADLNARMFTKDDATQMEHRIMEDRRSDIAELRRQIEHANGGREP